MSLTAISSLESARRKFFMNSTRTCVKTWNQTLAQKSEMSLSHKLARIGERKFFMNVLSRNCFFRRPK